MEAFVVDYIAGRDVFDLHTVIGTTEEQRQAIGYAVVCTDSF